MDRQSTEPRNGTHSSRQWHVVAVSMFALMATLGATSYAYGLFVLPVSQELGLDRADMNTGLILFNLGMAVTSPIVGRLIDRLAAPMVMAVCAILLGSSLIVLGLSNSLWLSAAVLAVPLACGVGGGGVLTAPAIVAQAFTEGRARAMAISALGISLGSMLLVPAIGLLIEEIGWRRALIVEGGVLGLSLFACALLLGRISAAPERSQDRAVPAAKSAGLSARQLAGSPSFRTLVLGAAIGFGVLQTIVVSIVPLARETGFAPGAAAGFLSIFGFMAIVGKLILAVFAARVDMRLLLATAFAILALACLILILATGDAALFAATALLGLAAGSTTPAFYSLLAERFGQASFGTANGAATLVIAGIGALWMRLGGELYDATGGYGAMLALSVALSSAAMLLLLLVPAGTGLPDRVQGQPA